MKRFGRRQVAEALRDRIVTGLHVGRYTGGERLPSVASFAREFGVNQRVVLAALRELADDSFLVVKPRSGAYVAYPHPGGRDYLPDIGAWVIRVAAEGRSRGLAPRLVGDYVHRRLAKRRLRAACIECNADQLHLLCSELASDYGFLTKSAEIDHIRRARLPAPVLDADVLITTMFHAAEVRAVAQKLGKPWRAVALRPDIIEDVRNRLRAGPVYYIAVDPRFEPKLRQMIGQRARLSNLRVLIAGKDKLEQIPAGAPTFVMTSARAQLKKILNGGAEPGLQFQPPRHFSDEAAREILSFMVEANL